MQDKPSFEQLGALRATPEYPKGEVIESAADLALNLGPPRKRSSRAWTSIAKGAVSASARVDSAPIDYESIDAQYASRLANAGAAGWADAENVWPGNEQTA